LKTTHSIIGGLSTLDYVKKQKQGKKEKEEKEEKAYTSLRLCDKGFVACAKT
jgi:hypothetical protein